MATRRRASFNAASLIRRPSISPEWKREEGASKQHHKKTTDASNATTASLTRRPSISPEWKREEGASKQQHKKTTDASNATNAHTLSSPAAQAPSSSAEKVTPNILTVLSSILTRLITRNELHFPVLTPVNENNKKKLSSFQGVRAPGISVGKYLERIHKYTNCSLSCFVVAYIYMDRLSHHQPDQPITSMNVHRLLVTSVMVAAKVIDDMHFNNAFYAKVGGISNAELNKLELNLLFCLDFRVQITSHVFEGYCSHMEKELHSIGYVPMQLTLPVFGDSEEAAHAEQLTEDRLVHK